MEEVDAEMLSQESTHCYDSLLCELLGMYFMDNMKRNRIIFIGFPLLLHAVKKVNFHNHSRWPNPMTSHHACAGRAVTQL